MSAHITRVLSETGYILHTRPYRETSLLLDIFTAQYGRISLVARGVRRKNSKRNMPLQLFTAYDFSWMGRAELYTLTQAEAQGSAHLLSPYQLCCGLYINELLLRVLIREDPHQDLYLAYQRLLKDLIIHQHTQIPLRLFEKKLLEHLGYGLSLDKIEPDKRYQFRVSEGFVHSIEEAPFCFSGESLVALSSHALEEKHLPEIKRLMRVALSTIIGEKPLKSRELFV